MKCKSILWQKHRKKCGYTNLLNLRPIVKSSSEHKQIVSNRESISMLRSVCWVKKWSLSAWPDGIVSSHSSTGHFLSANSVLHNSLRMESEAKVPAGPWSSASSQTFSQPIDRDSNSSDKCLGWVIQSLFQLVRAVCLDNSLFQTP